MATRKTLLVGGAVLAVLLTALFLNNALPFSIASQGTVQYTQSGTFSSIREEPLTSGSWSLDSEPPVYECVNYNGQVIDPAQITSTQNINLRCQPTGEIILMFNDRRITATQDLMITPDAYTTIIYRGSSLSSNNAQGIPTAWSNNFELSIDSSFLRLTTPANEPSTIAWKSAFQGEVDVQNSYVPMEGSVTVQQSSILAFIGTSSSVERQSFLQGMQTINYGVNTDELLGRNVEIITALDFSRGSVRVFSLEGARLEKTYEVTPGGIVRTAVTAPNTIIVPIKKSSPFQTFWEKIITFFRGSR